MENSEFWQGVDGEWQNWEILAPVAGPDGVRYSGRGIQTYFEGCLGVVSSTCKYPEIVVALIADCKELILCCDEKVFL